MKTKLFFLSICLFCALNNSYTQNYPVKLRVVDKTFGIKTSNENCTYEDNVVAGLSEQLKFQGKGTGNWYYPLFVMSGTTGQIVKNDTAWIWQATVQAPVGTHSWRPCTKSSGYKALNKLTAYYGGNDELYFSVDAAGKVSGTTEVIIQDTQFPVTLKVIDQSKGYLTNGAGNDANVCLQGGKSTDKNVRTDLQNEFIVHNAPAKFATDKFEYSSGVNIGVWLSQTSNRGGTSAENYFKKTDLKNLADMGFDHIRLPVDEKELFNTDLSFKTNIKNLIHSAIGWCEEYNMRLVLDLHIIRSHDFNHDKNAIKLWQSVGQQDTLVLLWQKISAEYGKYSNSLLAYELLNEVNAPNATIWNNVSARLIADIRTREPNRMLIFGGISHNSASALTALTVPKNDPNLALVFHFYSPHLLTHYKASWMDGLKNLTVPLHYPGQLVEKKDIDALPTQKDKDVVNYYNGYYNKATLKDKMKAALDKAAELGLRLYCSEYGTINTTPADLRYRWSKDVAEIFHENNIAFAIWGWKANFGILNDNGTIRDQRTIDIITKKAGGTSYDMFPELGEVIEKNDTAWIWSSTVQVRTGTYLWRPALYSENKSINESVFRYDSNAATNGFLSFNVSLDGTVSGETTLLITDKGIVSVENTESTDRIKVYPSSFFDFIIVEGAQLVEIFDITGKVVVNQAVNPNAKLNTSDLQKGMYVLVADNQYSYKLIK